MFRFSAVSILALGLTTGAALADVTAEDVWQDWRAYLAGFGYEITGTPERGAGRIVIPDLGIMQNMPDAGGRVEMRLGRIELAERGDGTVSVIYPESLPMAFAVTPVDGEAVTAIVTMGHSGLEITASGTPEAMRYVYTADDLRFDLAELMVDGAPAPEIEAGLRMAGLAGASMLQSDGEARILMQDFTAGATSYAIHVENPADETAFDYAGEVQSLSYDARMRTPEGVDLDDMAAALAAGLSVEGRLAFGAGEGRFSATEAGETMRGSSRSARTDLDVRLSSEGLAYGLTAEAMQAEIAADGLPMPVGYEIARLAARLDMPLSQTAEMQDFGLVVDLGGVSLSEAIWSMIDPDAHLPRDPADLAVDLSGRGRLTSDIFDQDKMALLAERGEAPGVIERLDLNRLLVSLAGAKLTGTGAVEIGAPAGMAMPPAEGAVDLRLEGGNDLLDRLIAMGMLPEDQATMVRMMAAMFAQQVEGEDTLVSRVELKKDGEITVNGQRLR